MNRFALFQNMRTGSASGVERIQNAPSGFMSNHNSGCVGVGRSDIGKNGCIYDTKTVYSEDLEIGVDHRILNVRSHPARSTGMIDRGRALSEIVQNVVITHARQVKIRRPGQYGSDRLRVLNSTYQTRHSDNTVKVLLHTKIIRGDPRLGMRIR